MTLVQSDASNSPPVGLKEYLDGIGGVVKKMPSAWVKCELHSLKLMSRCTRMEFLQHDAGKQIAKAHGVCWSDAWQRISTAFRSAGLPLEAGSQILVKLEASLHPSFGFQVTVLDIDLTFSLGDLNARLLAIRSHLQEIGVWESNKALPRPRDYLRVAVISPAGAAGLGDFRSTVDRLASVGLAEFIYYEAPFQTREAPERITEILRRLYRECRHEETRYDAIAIIRGGGASADLAWLVDLKLAEAVCRMKVPVMTGIGHERDRTILDEVACIACDTPSKVAEYIRSTILNEAMAGHHAYELVQKQVGQSLDRSSVGLNESRFAVHRDAIETVRLAETRVRTAATGLEPDARQLLEQTKEAVASAEEQSSRGARQSREAAGDALQALRRQIDKDVQSGVRSLELGAERTLSEISARVDAVPQAAKSLLEGALREIRADAGLAAAEATAGITNLKRHLHADAVRTIDECSASIAMAQVRADAVHPRTVLAAGYAILRDPKGAPLTSAEALRVHNRVVAEMRDGTAEMLPRGKLQQSEETK
jgi:exodeoxyribonuclease VII large subunit